MAEPEGRPADLDLIRRVQSGDTAAFDELMQRYARSVYKVTYSLMRSHADADDTAQETFIRAFRAIGRYDPTWRFYTWLRRIAVNVCLNELKRRNRFRLVPLPQSDGDAECVDVPDPNPTAVDATLRRDLDAALGRLPEDQRAVFVLRVNEELSYNEISELLRIPVGTVMSRLNRARTRLRELLKEYLPRK
ncbi:MAG: sigma-70 family RNA polymerase sigma factor [bacterium]